MTRALIPILVLLTAGLFAEKAVAADPAEHAWEIITEGFKDSNPDKRKEVVNAASLAAPNQKIYGLVGEALRDSDVQVRLAACGTLSSWRDKRSIPLLKSATTDEVPEVVFCAAQGLWQQGDPEGRTLLLSVLEGETRTSSDYLSKQKRQALRMFKTPMTLVTTLARFGVGFAPVPGLGTGLSSLQDLMKNNEFSGRALAVLDLTQDNHPQTAQALRNALNDKDWAVRAAAVHALAVRNQANVLSDVIPLMDDKKDGVR